MTNQATLDKLTSMRLLGMKNAFDGYLQTSTEWTNDELIARLTEAEWEHRQNLKVERLMKNARFRYPVQIADINFEPARGLDKNLFLRLTGGKLIQANENLIITGPTGVGKSFLACAIGHQACMLGYKTLYFNTRKLFHALHAAMADDSYLKLITKIEKQDLLILDDFGLHPMDAPARQALLEIIEDRHSKRSTIITSQLTVKDWHPVIGDSAVADAILDRLVHVAHRIQLKGDSLRRKKAPKEVLQA
jgi:DNA replication protein DnaC